MDVRESASPPLLNSIRRLRNRHMPSPTRDSKKTDASKSRARHCLVLLIEKRIYRRRLIPRMVQGQSDGQPPLCPREQNADAVDHSSQVAL